MPAGGAMNGEAMSLCMVHHIMLIVGQPAGRGEAGYPAPDDDDGQRIRCLPGAGRVRHAREVPNQVPAAMIQRRWFERRMGSPGARRLRNPCRWSSSRRRE